DKHPSLGDLHDHKRGEGSQGLQGWAVRVTPSTLVSMAETDPMSTLDFMSTGIRAASLVTHTRILPSFRKRPLNGMIARMRMVSNSPSGPLIRSAPSIFSSSR